MALLLSIYVRLARSRARDADTCRKRDRIRTTWYRRVVDPRIAY